MSKNLLAFQLQVEKINVKLWQEYCWDILFACCFLTFTTAGSENCFPPDDRTAMVWIYSFPFWKAKFQKALPQKKNYCYDYLNQNKKRRAAQCFKGKISLVGSLWVGMKVWQSAVNAQYRLVTIPPLMSAPVWAGGFQVGNSALKCNNQSETVFLISDAFGSVVTLTLEQKDRKRTVNSSILPYFTALFENYDHEFKRWQGKWFVLKQSSPDVFQRSWP